MFKASGILSYNLCFSQLLTWHILWLKRGSSYPCCMIMSVVADNVLIDVETSDSCIRDIRFCYSGICSRCVYVCMFSCCTRSLNIFLFEDFCLACIYSRGVLKMLCVLLEGEYFYVSLNVSMDVGTSCLSYCVLSGSLFFL
jgi:hypothetical protein